MNSGPTFYIESWFTVQWEQTKAHSNSYPSKTRAAKPAEL